VADPDPQIKGWGGGKGGHPDPEIKGAGPPGLSPGFATDSDFKNS